jgi:hypothetical protein
VAVKFESLDGRAFTFENTLKVESVAGFASWRIYGLDDVARRLEEIAETLHHGFTGFNRLKVETYTAADREEESRRLEERRQDFIRQQAQGAQLPPEQQPTAPEKPRRSRAKTARQP